MRFLRRLCAVLTGSVFFVSGLLKVMDPVGTSLIVGEYFNFLHLGFLSFSSKCAALVLAFAESVIGAALITGVWKKICAVASGAVIAFFTVITAVLLVFNPQMDCGCFGEAVHLTHLQSFIKNIVLCLLWVGAFVPFNSMEDARKTKYAAFLAVAVSVVLFGAVSMCGIPLMDFTDFAPGAELRSVDEEGLEDSPMLSFFDDEGNYRDSLALGGEVMVFSVYDPSSFRKWDRIASCSDMLEEKGFDCVVLSNDEAPLDCFYADRRDLMTLNRSNGGLTYISDGQIVAKWPVRALLSEQEAEKIIITGSDQMMMKTLSRGKLLCQGFLLYAFAVMLLL